MIVTMYRGRFELNEDNWAIEPTSCLSEFNHSTNMTWGSTSIEGAKAYAGHGKLYKVTAEVKGIDSLDFKKAPSTLPIKIKSDHRGLNGHIHATDTLGLKATNQNKAFIAYNVKDNATIQNSICIPTKSIIKIEELGSYNSKTAHNYSNLKDFEYETNALNDIVDHKTIQEKIDHMEKRANDPEVWQLNPSSADEFLFIKFGGYSGKPVPTMIPVYQENKN